MKLTLLPVVRKKRNMSHTSEDIAGWCKAWSFFMYMHYQCNMITVVWKCTKSGLQHTVHPILWKKFAWYTYAEKFVHASRIRLNSWCWWKFLLLLDWFFLVTQEQLHVVILLSRAKSQELERIKASTGIICWSLHLSWTWFTLCVVVGFFHLFLCLWDINWHS